MSLQAFSVKKKKDDLGVESRCFDRKTRMKMKHEWKLVLYCLCSSNFKLYNNLFHFYSVTGFGKGWWGIDHNDKYNWFWWWGLTFYYVWAFVLDLKSFLLLTKKKSSHSVIVSHPKNSKIDYLQNISHKISAHVHILWLFSLLHLGEDDGHCSV